MILTAWWRSSHTQVSPSSVRNPYWNTIHREFRRHPAKPPKGKVDGLRPWPATRSAEAAQIERDGTYAARAGLEGTYYYPG